MGFLIYGNAAQYAFDDRTLVRLKVAIVAKLRMQEGFLLSWRMPAEEGDGRISIWLSPAIQVQFITADTQSQPLNRTWLVALTRSSNGTGGVVVISEQEAEVIGTGDPTSPEVVASRTRRWMSQAATSARSSTRRTGLSWLAPQGNRRRPALPCSRCRGG